LIEIYEFDLPIIDHSALDTATNATAFDATFGSLGLEFAVSYHGSPITSIINWNVLASPYLELDIPMPDQPRAIASNCPTTNCYYNSLTAIITEKSFQVFQNNLSHLYYYSNTTLKNFPSYEKNSILWASENLMLAINNVGVTVLTVSPTSYIVAKELTTNVTLQMDTRFGGVPTDTPYTTMINFFVVPETTPYINKWGLANEIRELTTTSQGFFLLENEYAFSDWFMGNYLSYSITCTPELPVENSNVLQWKQLAPRRYNINVEGLTAADIFHLANSESFPDGSFVNVIQIQLVIYINKCALGRNLSIRCIQKGIIQESSMLIESVVTKKLFAYKVATGWKVYKLDPITKLINLENSTLTCTDYPKQEFVLACSDQSKIQIILYSFSQTPKILPTQIRRIENIYVQKLKSSILFTGILFGLGDGNIKIIDIYNGIVLNIIQEDFTLDNRFWFNLVDRYLVIVCTSRNSIAEYFIGDPSRPVLTGPELKLGELPGEKYMILDAHSHDGSRVGLTSTPVAVRSMDEHHHIKMLYFKVGASKFNRFEMVIDLYVYKPFTNFFLQTIVLTAPGFTGKQEVLSVVDTSTAAAMAANCGPKDAKGNPTA
jgi:hypothetical protein